MKKLLIVFIVSILCNSAYATRWIVSGSGFSFSPDPLTITLGDTVVFQLAGIHNVQEVDQATWNANLNSPVIGFQTGFGGGMVTGLAVGTHYYVCQSHVSSGMKGRIIVNAPVIPKVWINEIHYDNSGTDTLEGIEIAGPSGADLSCFKLALYNGTTGAEYFSQTLSGLIPFQNCAYGTIWVPFTGSDAINNGPDAVALVFAPQATGCGLGGFDTVMQFLSYEGNVTATAGAANGKTAIDIGVSESGNDAIGNSLQLTGTGNAYNQFIWQTAGPATRGAVNTGQNFCLVQHITVSPQLKYEYEIIGAAYPTYFSVTLDNPGQNATSVTMTVSNTLTSPYGKAKRGVDFFFNDTTITWPANFAGAISLPVVIVDDAIYETHEDAFIVATNPTNGAIVTADSFFNIGIIGNDGLSYADCSDLFISEYIDGTGNNKAIEIYNPTSLSVDLEDFRIFKSVNGGSSSAVFGLSGVLAPLQVYVAANPLANATILAKADTLSNFFDFDGNDAVALLHLRDTIDVIGQIGVDPGSNGWGLDSGGTTAGHTIIRGYYIYAGKKDWAIADTQWYAHPVDMTDSLGFHNTGLPCGSGPPPEPAILRFTSLPDTVYEQDTILRVAVRVDNPSNVPAQYYVARYDQKSTASAGQDYDYVVKIFSHGMGTFYDTVELTIKDDALTEELETVYLHFINTSFNVILAPDSLYSLSVIDTDKLTIQFLGAGFSHIEDAGEVQVRVTISTPVDSLITVIVDTTRSNAQMGTDYLFKRDTLYFLPNTIDTQFALVTILEDVVAEGNEQINFDIKSVTGGGAIIGISAYTLTIIDNDFVETGLGEVGFGDVATLFPNPASNHITIQTVEDFTELKIFDLPGNLVMDIGAIQAGTKSINIAELPGGMYFITAKNNNRNLSARFIKQ